MSTSSFKNLMTSTTIALSCLLLTACVSQSGPRSDTPETSEWHSDEVAADEFEGVATVEEDAAIEIDVDWETSANQTVVATSAGIEVAAIDPDAVDEPKKKPRRKSAGVTKKLRDILPPACAEPYRGQDETITLATTTHLKLRRGPSTHSDTLSVIAPGATVTARKLTCGNWTEIVDGKRPIGYLHSYFLTSPE